MGRSGERVDAGHAERKLMHIGLADDAPACGEYTLDDVGVTLRGRSIREGTAGRSGPIRGDIDGVRRGTRGDYHGLAQ